MKKEHWKSETNLSQTLNFVTDWANAKSMATTRYKFHGLRQISSALIYLFIFYLNLTEHWKSETNLSRTMKFVPDFHHRLGIGPVHDKIHGPRQIKKPFKSN